MAEPLRLAVRFCHHRVVVLRFNDLLLFYSCSNRFIGLSVFGSRIQAKDHGLGTVRTLIIPRTQRL